MNKTIKFERYNSDLETLFSLEEKFTFLAGAGISIDAPTNIPSAIQIVRSLLELCAPKEEINEILSLNTLRYELMIEKLKLYLDENLHFLDYLELITEPNFIHLFLASAMIQGHNVMTTNFDYMIETALTDILLDNEYYNVIPVITRDDYEQYFRPLDLLKMNKYPVYKIHGSKKNIITEVDTTESLITTLGALGRDREMGETFALESFKKQTVYNLLKDHTLVVMGYSGSDDFDIGPMLKTLPYIKKLIWIEHVNSEDIEVLRVCQGDSEKDFHKFSRSESVMGEIALHLGIEVFQIKANTGKFVRNVLWKLLMPHFPYLGGELPREEDRPDFHHYISEEFKEIDVQELDKYLLACSIYLDLNQDISFQRCALKGLQLAEHNEDFTSQMHLLNQLGVIAFKSQNYAESISFFQRGLEIAEKVSDSIRKADFLTNVSAAQIELRDMFELGTRLDAKTMFQEALAVYEENREHLGRITALDNLSGASLISHELESSLNLLMEAYMFTMSLGNLKFKSEIAMNIGLVCDLYIDPKSAQSKLEEALSIKKQLGDLKSELFVHYLLGNFYYNQGQYNTALEHYTRSLERKNEIVGPTNEIECLLAMGWAYYKQNDLDRALETHERALKLCKASNNKIYEALIHNAKGFIFYLKNDLDLAFNSYKTALVLLKGFQNVSQTILTINKQIEINIQQISSKITPDLNGLRDHLTPISMHITDEREKLQFLEGELEKIYQWDLVSKKAQIMLDIGILHLLQNNKAKAREYLERGLELLTRMGKLSEVESYLSIFASYGLILKPININSFPFQFLFNIKTDIMEKKPIWIASMQSRQLSKNATLLLEEGNKLFNEGRIKEALPKFEEIFEIWRRLGEIDAMNDAKSIIATLKFNLALEKVQTFNQKGFNKVIMEEIPELIQSSEEMMILWKEVEEEMKKYSYPKEITQEKGVENTAQDLESSFGKDITEAASRIFELEQQSQIIFLSPHLSEEKRILFQKFEEAIKIAEQTNRIQQKIDLLNEIANYAYNLEEYDYALNRFEQAYFSSILLGIEKLESKAKSLKGIGLIKLAKEEIDSALNDFEQSLRLYEEVGNEEEIYYLSCLTAAIYKEQNDDLIAYERFIEGFKFSHDKASHVFKADALLKAGLVCGNLYKLKEQYSLLNEALSLIESTEEEDPEKDLVKCSIISNLAPFYYYIGKKDEGKQKYLQAIELWNQLGNKENVEYLRENLERMEKQLIDPEKYAIQFISKNLDDYNSEDSYTMIHDLSVAAFIFEFRNQIKNKILIECRLADYYWIQGKLPESILKLNQLRASILQLKDPPELTSTKEFIFNKLDSIKDENFIPNYYKNCIAYFKDQKDFIKAIDVLKHLIYIYGLSYMYFERALHLFDLANIYNSQLKNNDIALQNFFEAANLFEFKNQFKNQALSLIRIGDIYNEGHVYNEAIKFYNQSFELSEKLSDDYLKVQILLSLSFNHSILGNNDIAINLINDGYNIASKLDLNNYKVAFSINLANIYLNQSEYRKCLEVIESGLKIVESLDNIYLKANIFLIKGELDLENGNYQAAIKNVKASYELFQELKDNPNEAETLVVLGRILTGNGLYQDAMNSINKSYNIYTMLKDSSGIAYCKCALAALYLKDNKYDKALDNAIKAFNVFNKLENGVKKAKCSNLIGDIYLKMNLIEEAIKWKRSSKEFYTQIGNQVMSKKLDLELSNR